MPSRKYEIERKLGEGLVLVKQLEDQLQANKEIVANIRITIQNTTKEKQIRKYEEEAQKAEAVLMEVQAQLQQSELKLNQLKREQNEHIVYPTCPSGKNSGNIFVFQAVTTETTINEHQLSENIPTTGTGIVYCIKCGHIIGTTIREKQK